MVCCFIVLYCASVIVPYWCCIIGVQVRPSLSYPPQLYIIYHLSHTHTCRVIEVGTIVLQY